METKRRLALLIDGDNAQAALLPQILAEMSKYGVVTIRRVYGDWSKPHLNSWRDVLETYALKPEQQFSYTSGKNLTDIALVVGAMDILYAAQVEGICIVSSDSDYTPLANRIRQTLFVIGAGRNTTPSAFQDACDVFIPTENLQPVTENGKKAAAAASQKSAASAGHIKSKATRKALLRLFQTAFESTVQDNDGWAHLTAVRNALGKDFNHRAYGYKKLSLLVEDVPDFIEVKKDKNDAGSEVIYIRLKRK